eukprot:6193859-Pleurochrysis_carterae.AAC.1
MAGRRSVGAGSTERGDIARRLTRTRNRGDRRAAHCHGTGVVSRFPEVHGARSLRGPSDAGRSRLQPGNPGAVRRVLSARRLTTREEARGGAARRHHSGVRGSGADAALARGTA